MQTAQSTAQPRRAAMASFIGTTIEWYDFYSYATAAALVFGPLFFPGENRLLGLLASFGSFAIGFLARPIGGVLFGRIGDKLGRKRALMGTLSLMAIATVLIGCLPTYAQAGWIAPVAQLGSAGGLILSMLAFSAVSRLEPEAFLAWGWRLPFLASAVLLAVGFVIRMSVNESPAFEAMQASGDVAKQPLAEALKAWPLIALAIGANVYGIAGVYFSNIFMISYATQYLQLDRAMILDCMFWVAVLQFFVQLGAATLADRFGTRRMLVILAAFAMVVPFIMLPLVRMGEAHTVFAGVAIATLAESGYYAIIAGFVSGMFAARIRYTAISLSYQVCGAFAGGLTPLLATVLADRFFPLWWPMAIFYAGFAALSLICVLSIGRSRPAAEASALDARAA
ncbi:MAG: MFS transporter [Ralstonia sp.]|uniref:MFS transporter n=1 Tax=Ralstonia pickettii TaxID=329 RepID=A0A9Q3LLU4_RALPI|nr:MFS transporter [Ralstonia pickettii]MBA9844376.1 MFS transporter [Ralstonia pickettii]MBA9850177.1 MFS transporter [Ralstonia pickettii]MBA9876425.1 MFS transporter [Ralstonia pickettii]MBA9881000.1 MFS transporter [Ralstonia pickettii]MBA9886233.1 MFS transporter [Ralstonia pickettii]